MAERIRQVSPADLPLESIEGNNGKRDWADSLEPGDMTNVLKLYMRENMGHRVLTHEEEIGLAQIMEEGEKAEIRLGMRTVPQEKGKPTQRWLELSEVAKDESPLARKEEERLKEAVERGEAARRIFFKMNQRLVVSISKRYADNGVEPTDLIQEGGIGLIRAIEKFDWRKGNKLSTYATGWIRQGVTRAIADQGRTIRLPAHMVERVNKLENTRERLLQKLGREPSREELAAALDTTVGRVEKLEQFARDAFSLDKLVNDEKGTSFADLVADESEPSPFEETRRHVLRDDVDKVLDLLTPRERRILELRSGLRGDGPHTLEEVGDKFGLTRERIRQIEKEALGRLRRQAVGLRDYLE